jgi:hypothetical protein
VAAGLGFWRVTGFFEELMVLLVFLRAVLCALLLGVSGLTCASFGSMPQTCMEHFEVAHKADSLAARKASVEAELQDFTRLAEETLAMRERAIKLYAYLQEKMKRSEPFSGRDLQRLNEGSSELLAQRSALMRVAEGHECWLKMDSLLEADEFDLRAAAISMSLSAALILYDNYLTAISLYRDNSPLRQKLNQEDRSLARRSGALNSIAESFTSADKRRRVRQAITWYEQYAKRLSGSSIEAQAYVVQLIEQSPSLKLVRSASPGRYIGRHVELFGLITLDSVRGVGRQSSNLTSLLFGNAVGMVELRRGKLYQRSDVLERLTQKLTAGDILLEKTPFRLTDNFIPGHWGHAAIWIGTEGELRALGVWDHPLVRPYQQQVREGRGVVEALRSGVEMNKAQRFLNVDDLAVLHHRGLTAQERANIVLQSLSHVGKPYDFNFDVESTHRIFCSKLVYLVYGDLDWPTSRVLGRSTISPDNVAQRAVGNGPLEVTLLYRDGLEVPADQARHQMEQLLRTRQLAMLSSVERSTP